MFNEYYYIERNNEPVYISIITLNNSVETSLYRGKSLAVRKSLQRGIHLLQKDRIRFKIQIKWFKVITELKIDNEVVFPLKLKRKELRAKLKGWNITNELNPKIMPNEPFKISILKTPIILLTIGTSWQILLGRRGKFWEIPSMLLFFIASIYLFGSLVDKIPERHLDSETKGKFKLVIGFLGMGIAQFVINELTSI